MKLSNVIQNSSDLGKLQKNAEKIAQLTKTIASKLDPELAKNCKVANLRQGFLILTTTSPAWKHKLRFLSVDLLESLRTDPRWAGLTGIEVIIDYPPEPVQVSSDEPLKPKPLSAENAQILKDIKDKLKKRP